jgi:signal transduction histidine kinase
MTLNLALPLTALLLNVLLGGAALVRGRPRALDWLFAAFAWSMVVWNGGVFWLRAAGSAHEAAFAEVVIHVGVIALPAVYLHFVLEFLGVTDGRRRLYACYLVAGGFTVLNLVGSEWLMRGVTRTYWGWAPAPGPLYAPFVVFFNAVMIHALWRLARSRAALTSSYHRNRISLVMVGTIVSLAGGAVDFLRFIVARVVPEAERVYPIGIPANMVFALVLGTAIMRYRLCDVSAALKAVVAYSTVGAACIAALAAALMALGTPAWPAVSGWLAVVGIGLVVALTLGPPGRRLDRFIRQALYADTQRTHDRLLALSNDLSTTLDRQDIVDRLLDGVSAAIPVSHCVLLTPDDQGAFVIGDRRVHAVETIRIEPLAATSALARHLQTSRPVVRDEALLDPAFTSRLGPERDWLVALPAAVLVPLRVQDQLTGILILGEKLSGQIFRRPELELLGVVTGQVASALANARLYEAVRKAYEDLASTQAQNERLEAAVAARTRDLADANERLTILDRSKTEFLNLISHELRTPLNGLIGVGELILDEMAATRPDAELREMFEISRGRILSIVDDAVLLTQIDVKRDPMGSVPVSLDAVLGVAIERTRRLAESRGVGLARPPSVPDLVLGNHDLLVRAFHALLETAVKFSAAGETIRLLRHVVSGAPGIVIEGRGRTLPDHAVGRFFDLFAIAEASTEAGDLGLGPPVASRILALFGASVSVAALAPSGLRLTVRLPTVRA